MRQVEAKALRKLQHPVRSRKLEGFLDGSILATLGVIPPGGRSESEGSEDDVDADAEGGGDAEIDEK